MKRCRSTLISQVIASLSVSAKFRSVNCRKL